MMDAAKKENQHLSLPDNRLVRIDFAPPHANCWSCQTALKIAWIISDAAGNEGLYGKSCARKKLPPDDFVRQRKTAPNLTLRHGNDVRNEENKTGGTGRQSIAANTTDDRRKRATEYLILRIVKIAQLSLEHRSRLQWGPFMQKFSLLQDGKLSDRDVDWILRTEENAPAIYKRINLLDVYSAASQLDRRIAEYPDNDDLLITKGILLAKMKLTPSRVAAAKLSLHNTAFIWQEKNSGHAGTFSR